MGELCAGGYNAVDDKDGAVRDFLTLGDTNYIVDHILYYM